MFSKRYKNKKKGTYYPVFNDNVKNCTNALDGTICLLIFNVLKSDC